MRPDRPFAPCLEVANATTLVDVLAWRARTTPDRVGFLWLDGAELLEQTPLTYAALYDQVCRVAARLTKTLEHGDRAVLLFDSGLEFLRTLLGCQAAGVVPVPVMPPRDGSPAEIGRVMRILADAATHTVVTTAPIARLAAALPGAEALNWRVLDLDGVAPIDPRAPTDLALLQYTSGSTAAPRGVMVGHDNLLRNLAYIHWGENNGPESVSVSWLPMTHDMGLVEGVLTPLFSGHPVHLFHPSAFLKRPLLWLEVIHRTGATVSGGPNFAYELVLRRLGDGPLPRLDLSRWRFAYNGSEPVRPETVDAFCARMAPLGFRREAFQPLYGMAEATLGVTAGRFGNGPRFQQRTGPQGERRVVSCGHTPEDLSAVVVDPESGTPLAEGEEGEIWLAGPCIARGYWRNPVATEATFGARLPGDPRRYLRTGDLGFLLEEEVFVTGRRKELIICRGANVHPQDLEVTAEAAHPALRPGGAVAFGVDEDGFEAVVLVAEVQRNLPEGTALSAVVAAIRSALARSHGVPVFQVALVKAGTVPRTTSGKRQRARVAASWRRGELPVLERSSTAGSDASGGLGTWLPARVATLLGVDTLDASRTLPELGLGSLAVIELLAELEERFGGVTLGALLTRPLHALTDGVEPVEVPRELPAQLQPAPGILGQAVLLTGVTGFVGARIARELLETTDRTLLCLVRGDARRVLAHLAAQPGWNPAWATRIEPVPGDLGAAGLGLDEQALEALSGRLGSIIHAGAMVNWVYPTSALAPTNVGGTRELLALACRRSTPFVFLSSLACCWSLTADGVVDGNTDPAGHLDGIHLPYVQTKALAESLVRQAGARGLPVSILRPGLVMGDSGTGHSSPGDFLSSLFKGCLELGAVPDLDWDLEVCAVDEVARMAVQASNQPVGTVHVASPTRSWRGVVLWMTLRGHPLELLPYDTWCARLLAANTTLRPLEPFFTRPVLDRLRVPELYERSRRNPIVRPNPPEGAPLDAAYLERVFADLTAQGHLPGTTEPAPAPPPPRTARDFEEALGRPVDAAHLIPWPAGHTSASLIGELASWRYGRAAGVRRWRLTAGRETWTVVEKAQVQDTVALQIGERVAALCSPALGSAWRAHLPHSELVRSAQRERALYTLDLPRPAFLGGQEQVLLLEDVSAHVTDWGPGEVRRAIEGLSRIHGTSVSESSWLPPARTAATLQAQQPLWDALAEHALRGPVGRWLGPLGRKRYEAVLTEVEAWGALRDGLAQTLIHNDLSPRNATLMRGELCAWDWELACKGLPQRDLAELLCFTSTAAELPGHLTAHRVALERAGLEVTHWQTGFEVALAELLVTRLSLYAMIDGFRTQPFLERVVRTWVELDTAVRGGTLE